MNESSGWIGQWSPGIGDPSWLGWATVVAYFFAAWLCWRSWSCAKREGDSAASLWGGVCLLLCALGVNKQLDLQSALTELGRINAHAFGWYDHRHLVQIGFIATATLVVSVSAAFFAIRVWPKRARYGLLIAGMLMLCVFVLVRASSFHGMDWLIGQTVVGIPVNVVLELGAISLTTWGARYYVRTTPSASSTSPEDR